MTDERRRRVRWMTFFTTLPVAVALLAIGAVLTGVAGLGYAAVRNYAGGNHSSAITQWGYAAKQHVIQDWKAPFGMGTSWLAREEYDQAQRYLERAYAATPAVPADVQGTDAAAGQARCIVAHNYALSFEGTADALRDEARLAAEAAGDADDPTAAIDTAIGLYESAIEDYTSAIDIRTADGCADDDTAREREEQKRQEAQDELDALRDPPPDDQPQDDPDSADPPPDSENPDDSDDTGDSNTDQNNPDDNPQQSEDDPGPDSDPDATQPDEPDSAEQQRQQQQLEDLAERQRLARERAELEQGGGEAPPTRGW